MEATDVVVEDRIVNRILLKPMLGVCPVLYISVLVMNRINTTEFAIFIYLAYSLLPKNLTILSLFFVQLEQKLIKCLGGL